ncbi:methyl-accepting chemotaxis protein [Tichowtungia aerotolerans]|uniref:HAMP domain-containing protein n=1 Tax=Tichowtungia aerotolerans TaxID=2697043 RepID=A0A6P1M537_9BACT|nr:methyl-accepting chemotaxis protein [Tichowtungia aerotolerans]QHI69700.1 HAMP domain-containing protein [Tichowtungia aerotolerans]
MFKNQTIGARLKTAFFCVSLLVALNGVIGILMVQIIGHKADEILQKKYPVAQISSKLQTDIYAEQLAFYSLLLGNHEAEDRTKQWGSSITEHLANLRNLTVGTDAKDKVEQLAASHKRLQMFASQLEKTEGNYDQTQMDHLEQEFGTLQEIVDHAEMEMTQAMQKADAAQTYSIFILLAVTLLAFAVAFWLGQRISVGITTPLKTLVEYSRHIETGNLSEQLTIEDSNDETGLLAKAFISMADGLRGISSVAEKISHGDLTGTITPRSDKDSLGGSLLQMIISLREQVQEIIDGAAVIASSVSELSASSAQLASSAAENATSISETTTTVEEVRQTAELASTKAEQMANESHRIRETSQQGQKSTGETIQGMNKIQEQMSAIAETIIRLSEQSQAIGQIIATVDSLAEQSNVLAVNASIEAAKAGEHGKGFSVVAQEVKSLAEQSKQATTEVRGILNEIQKATSTAVMATEQGNKVVEKGTASAAQAGQAIVALSNSLDQSADAATQIAAASQQQRVGMDQITAAMESVSEASQQNASSAKQLEGAVHSLKLLGEKLKGIVENYRI